MDSPIKRENSESENFNSNQNFPSNPVRKSPSPFDYQQREQQFLQLQQMQQQNLYGMGFPHSGMPGYSPGFPGMPGNMMGMPIAMGHPGLPMLYPPPPNSMQGNPYAMALTPQVNSPSLSAASQEMVDPVRSHRNSFDALSDYNFRVQQIAMQQQQALQQQHQQQVLNLQSSSQNSFRNEKMEPIQNNKPANGNSAALATTEERYQQLLEKEARWAEVRKYSELIRRFATDAVNVEITKENYYDLYNMAVCLLRSVDSLDPDKTNSMLHLSQRKGSNETVNPPTPTFLAPNATNSLSLQQTDLDFLQARKSFDVYFSGRGSVDGSYLPKFSADYTHLLFPNLANSSVPPALQNTAAAVPPSSNSSSSSSAVKNEFNNSTTSSPKVSTPSSESADNDDDQDDRRGNKRRRRRTVYSSRRNLHCHMCGVTETPEWRRGPAGDHTLCNACGLHWAKSQKKKPTTATQQSTTPSTETKISPPEGRKHSIDMILNNGSTSPRDAQDDRER